MIDFWISILITFSITVITILTEWIASKIIVYSGAIARLRKILFSGMTASDATKKAKEELNRLKSSSASSNAWGTNLASVAISMDFTALGIWIYKKSFFPFFQKFNHNGEERELQIWLLLIILHIILLLISLILKHYQQESIGQVEFDNIKEFLKSGWLKQNKWILTSNFIGFITLLTSIIIFTNSI